MRTPRASHVLTILVLATSSVAATAISPSAPHRSGHPPAAGGSPDAAQRQRDFLAWEAGTWKCAIEVLDPTTGQWARHEGEQVDRMGACGLWLITDLKMTRGPGGAPPSPYEGHGVLGYDPVEQKLVGLWVDSKTDWLATSEGHVSEDGQTLRLTVQGRDPASGMLYPQEYVTTRIDEKNRRLEVFVPGPDGQRMAVARIESKRTGKAPAAGH